jgi:hypothetical protein
MVVHRRSSHPPHDVVSPYISSDRSCAVRIGILRQALITSLGGWGTLVNTGLRTRRSALQLRPRPAACGVTKLPAQVCARTLPALPSAQQNDYTTVYCQTPARHHVGTFRCRTVSTAASAIVLDSLKLVVLRLVERYTLFVCRWHKCHGK